MRFIKGEFFIIGENDKSEVVVDTRTGWLDYEQRYGFHKFRDIWVGTDLLTGRSVYQAKTRKAVAEWIETHLEFLERCYNRSEYQELKDEFEQIKNEMRGKI